MVKSSENKARDGVQTDLELGIRLDSKEKRNIDDGMGKYKRLQAAIFGLYPVG